MIYEIDNWGFLRRDGKIIGWTPYDFYWAVSGRIKRWLSKNRS